MPITDTDLMVLQQGTTPFKVSTKTLKTYFQQGVTLNPATASVLGGIKVGTNLTVTADGTLSANVTGALIYKGVRDLTTAAPAGPTTGDLYISNKAGTIDASYTGIAGDAAAVGDMIMWDGAKWDHVGASAASGVKSVTGTAPVTIGGTATDPDVSVALAAPSVAGAGGNSGLLSAVDKEKLDGIASGAQAGTVTNVSGTAPIQVATGTTTPVITVQDASTTAKGVVQLADAAAVTAGTAGLAVTADQLKATNDIVATAVTSVVATAPLSVTGTATRTIVIADATASAKGAVQLATTPEMAYNHVSPPSSKAATPAGVQAHYMPKDISLLTLLP